MTTTNKNQITSRSLKVRTSIKAGAVGPDSLRPPTNHNQTLVRGRRS